MNIDGRVVSVAALTMLVQMNPGMAPVAGVAAIVGVAVVGGLLVYDKYEESRKAEIEEEIKAINAAFQANLEKIISISGQWIGFAPPFERAEDGSWKAAFLTDAQIADLGSRALSSVEQKAPLDYYRYHLSEAIRLLKQYYFMPHSHKNGTTKRLVTYLLVIIEKSFGYEGRTVDLAILDALMLFVLECAGMRGSNSRRFTALMPVYEHLKCAKTKGLAEHHQIWPLEEAILDLRTKMLSVVPAMIQQFVKFTISPTQWSKVEFLSIDLLAKGVMKEKTASRCCRVSVTTGPEVLPETTVTRWIQLLAAYYENTMEAFENTNDIPLSSQFDYVGSLTFSDRLYIQDVFSGELSEKLSNADKNKRIALLLKGLSDCAKLIYFVITEIRLTNQLLTVFQKIGELEAKNPRHCAQLYRLFDELSERILQQIAIVDHQFDTLRESGGRRWVAAEKLVLKIDRELAGMAEYIREKAHYVRDRRNRFDLQQLIDDRQEMQDQAARMVEVIRHACGFAEDAVAVSVLPDVMRNEVSMPVMRGVITAPVMEAAVVAPVMMPADFQKIMEAAKNKSTDRAIQLLYGICALLGDYTHQDKPKKVAFLMNVRRHYVAEISRLVEGLKQTLTTATPENARVILTEILTALTALKNQPNFSQGTLSARMDFIFALCEREELLPVESARFAETI